MANSVHSGEVLRQPSHTEKEERKKRHKPRADIDLEDDKKATVKDEKKKKKKSSGDADERKNDPTTTTRETEEPPPHKKSKKRKLIDGDDDTAVPKKQRKSKAATTSEHPDPSKDDTLSDQSKKAMSYVYSQTTDAQNWKFNKAKQNWIIRNLWSSQAIPEKYEYLVIRYLSKVQGRVKETLVEACKKHTAEGDAEDKRQRAQTLLNALTIDT